MTLDQLCYGAWVRWQGQRAQIIDIQPRQYTVRVRIRVPLARPRTRWVAPGELEGVEDAE